MKFTIRDLLWLTLLAAVAVAWWLDRSRLAAELDEHRRLTLELGISLRDGGTIRVPVGSP